MKWVKLKCFKELEKLGFEISASGDGSNLKIHKEEGMSLYIDSDPEPRMVVNCSVIHENALKMFPEAFEEVVPG